MWYDVSSWETCWCLPPFAASSTKRDFWKCWKGGSLVYQVYPQILRLKVFRVPLLGPLVGSYLFTISCEYVGNEIVDVMRCPLQWGWTTRKKALPKLISETQSCRSVLHTSEALKGKIGGSHFSHKELTSTWKILITSKVLKKHDVVVCHSRS